MQKHLASILTILVIVIVGLSFYRNPELRTGHGLSRIPSRHAAAFDLAAKDPGTHGFYSPRLGVGFTYLAPERLHVRESGSTISLGDKAGTESKTIEVFSIAPATGIADAVRDNFLAGISEDACYVGLLPIAANPYQAAAINYPVNDRSDLPWWDNETARMCPEKYRATNGISYFLFNAQVPDKLLFVKLGQDALATDGTTVTEGQQPFDWSESIRILE